MSLTGSRQEGCELARGDVGKKVKHTKKWTWAGGWKAWKSNFVGGVPHVRMMCRTWGTTRHVSHWEQTGGLRARPGGRWKKSEAHEKMDLGGWLEGVEIEFCWRCATCPNDVPDVGNNTTCLSLGADRRVASSPGGTLEKK